MTGEEAIGIIKRSGITQREFGELVGVSQSTLQKWANGGSLSGPSETLMLLLNELPGFVRTLRRVRGVPVDAERPKPGPRPKPKDDAQ